MLPDSRSNGKPRFSENIWNGVTILQWSKRFDAALGSMLGLALGNYSQKLRTRAATAQSRGG
jgi:hypothetical protein